MIAEESRLRTCESVRTVMHAILRELVQRPESLKVEYIFGDQTIIFEVDVEQSDFGRSLASNGKTISALRVLVTAMAASHGHRAIVQIANEDRFF